MYFLKNQVSGIFHNIIFPAVMITLFECGAYCNWLNTQTLPLDIPDDYIVRLPTEVEWERAARGTDGREYPWRDEFDLAYTNVSGRELITGVTGTAAVCTYPQGVSPAGAWDMSGNVWEWTQSRLDEKRLDRVMRGSSWFSSRRAAQCTARFTLIPSAYLNFTGFRVVVSPPN